MKDLKLVFFAGVGLIGSGIYFMVKDWVVLSLIIGAAVVLGVFFNMLSKILYYLEK